jgi:hypothetical protein
LCRQAQGPSLERWNALTGTQKALVGGAAAVGTAALYREFRG